MLFRSALLEGIAAGVVTLAFRRWRRPSVRAGGSLLTPVGQLGIKSVERVEPDRISDAEVRLAGYESRAVLLDELQRRTEGEVYRIELVRCFPTPALR